MKDHLHKNLIQQKHIPFIGAALLISATIFCIIFVLKITNHLFNGPDGTR